MDEQHDGDKILHQDAVEEVVRDVLNESSANGVWEAIVLPATLADGWNTDDASGTWVDNGGGSFSQTDPGTIGDFSIFTVADFNGLAWALQYELTIDAAVTDDGTFEHAMFADYPGVAESGVAGTGLYCSTSTLPDVTAIPLWLGSTGKPETMALPHALGAMHTYLVVIGDRRGYVLKDDMFVSQLVVGVSNGLSGLIVPGAARIALYNTGAATFENLKAWRIPFPTLPV